MKGLLYKDLCVMTRQMRIFLVMIAVFAVIPGYSMTGFAVVYAAMLPYTALAYDERAHWDSYAAMMPYTRRQLVLCKYILGWVAIVCAALLALVAKVVTAVVTGEALDGGALAAIPATAAAAFLILAFSLPPMFRFGVERGRMFFLVLVAAVAVSITALAGGLAEFSDTAAAWIFFGLGGLSLLLQPVSVLLSEKANLKRTA